MDKVRSFKLKASTWLQGYGVGQRSTSNPSSTAEKVLSDEDLALKRLDEMMDGRKYVQLVSHIHDIPDETFLEILESIPYRKLVKGMPETVVALDALFSRLDRLKTAHTGKVKFPKSVCDELMVQMSILLEMGENEPEVFAQELQVCSRVLKVIIRHYQELREKVGRRCRQMRDLVESLAQHVRIGSDSAALTLQEAIREEVNNTLKDLKPASEKLEILGLTDGTNPGNKPGSSRTLNKRKSMKSIDLGEQTHQDNMSVSQRHIQDRLIQNQSLMNVVKPSSRRGNLPALIDMLGERLRNDKDVLTIMTQIKSEVEPGGVSMEEPVEPLILRHIHAFSLLLHLWDACQAEILQQEQQEREDAEAEMLILAMGSPETVSSMAIIEEHTNGEMTESGDSFLNSSQTSESLSVMRGYRHSSRPSSVASSPHFPRALRSVFFDLAQQGQLPLPQSVAGSVQASPAGSRASSFRRRDAPASTDEFERQRQELLLAYEKINQLKKREKELTDRLSEQAQRQLEVSSKFEDVSLGLRPTQLIKRYEELYSQHRVDAIDGLDDLKIDLSEDGVDEATWKSHILFTVLKVQDCVLHACLLLALINIGSQNDGHSEQFFYCLDGI
jgi:hypothetical protein